jgi:hypothetical protein
MWQEALRLLQEEEAPKVLLTLAADFGAEGLTPELLFQVLQGKLAETLPVRTSKSESSPAGDMGTFIFTLETGARFTVEWYASTEGTTGESRFVDVRQG